MVGYGAHGFDADVLLHEIDQLDKRQFIGCLYGSGFEAQPELLQKIAEVIPLIGNHAQTVAAVKSVSQFFSALRSLNINHPEVVDVLPECCISNQADVFLKKLSGGCGGSHISKVSTYDQALLANEYYQRHIAGRSVSILFIADRSEIEVVGFNEQWVSPCDKSPFRYGGAASHVELLPDVKNQLIDAAKKLTVMFGLLGLNSLDAIVQNTTVYVLEVNPRLSATVDLYDKAGEHLIDRHVKVCLTQCGLNQAVPMHHNDSERSKAHAVAYAPFDMKITASSDWPDWAVDTPGHQDGIIKLVSGAPVCTVIAYADSAEEARKLAQDRVEQVLNSVS